METIKDRIEALLLATGRDGMEKLLKHMEEIGFYTAPCSTQYHLAREGGLAQHSMNVLDQAYKIALTLLSEDEYLKMERSIIICSLLHDLGKCGQFEKPNYVPNYKKGRATKANPNPEPIRSEDKPYKSNPDLMYVDHEIRSIQIASQFIRLTEDENWAILMHNGLYGSFKYQIQGKETPLYMIIHTADMWASRVVEVEGGVPDGEA